MATLARLESRLEGLRGDLVRLWQALRPGGGGEEPAPAPGCIRCGDAVLDTVHHRLELPEMGLPLTPNELALLQTLMSAPGKAFARIELLSRLRGGPAASTRAVDVNVCRLRRRLGARRAHLVTQGGAGYSWEASPACTNSDN